MSERHALLLAERDCHTSTSLSHFNVTHERHVSSSFSIRSPIAINRVLIRPRCFEIIHVLSTNISTFTNISRHRVHDSDDSYRVTIDTSSQCSMPRPFSSRSSFPSGRRERPTRYKYGHVITRTPPCTSTMCAQNANIPPVFEVSHSNLGTATANGFHKLGL